MLKPTLIGKVVTIQLFTRQESDSTILITDSLRKHVGILQAYSVAKSQTAIKLEGYEPIQIDPKQTYFEVFKNGSQINVTYN